MEGNASPHDAGENSSRRLSYIPYQRKSHSRNVSYASITSVGSDVSAEGPALGAVAGAHGSDLRASTPVAMSSSVGPSRLRQSAPTQTPTRSPSGLTRSGMTPSSPAPLGVGLVRSHRELDTPPPPLRVASKLKSVDPQVAQASPLGKPVERPTPLRQPSGGSTSILKRASDVTRSPQIAARTNGSTQAPRDGSTRSAQPQTDRTQARSSAHGGEPSRSSSSATSPQNSGSSTPVMGISVPAHVNSYAALLAAQSKLGPIPVPQGVALTNATGADPIKQPTDGRATAYRPGFQPKGVLRVRTDEFTESRRQRRSQGEMEEQRMDRRLEKLLAIHFAPISESDKAKEAKLSSFVDFDLDELKRDPSALLRKSGTDLWTSFRARGRGEDPAIRAAEQNIVMWQDDGEAKACPICDTPFSLSVRKHHCRLCGRVVCASPHLARLTWTEQMNASPEKPSSSQQRLALENRCSSNIIADPISGKIDDVTEGASTQGSNGAIPHKGVRICRDCKSIVRKRQYMLDDKPFPVFIKLYEALMRVQREIEQSLPEFQEMVLGLQKHDQNAALGSSIKANLELQRDAIQARKQLLSNFATYDELAKRIRKLPSDNDSSGNADVEVGDAAQERIQHAIFTRANLFLQQNMLPLQSLPKPGSKTSTADDASDSSVSVSASPRASSPQQGTRRSANGDNAGSAGSFRSLFGGGRRVSSKTVTDIDDEDASQDNTDPTELREQLKVLLEQEKLVADYVESAAKARKFDDARTLKKSHEELCKEILRIQRRLVVKGQGK